jgi:glycosyltransferase involved in cell wall biosynthesis
MIHRDTEGETRPTQPLIETSCHILLLEGQGRLRGVAPDQRSAWLGILQECQAPDGLYRDALSAPRDFEGELPAQALQTTYFALQALDALGGPSRYPLKFLDRFQDGPALPAWLDGLDWKDALASSEQVMAVLAGLIYQVEEEGEASAAAQFHQGLDWLQKSQEARSGLWGMQDGASLLDALAASGQLVPFFKYVHRPILCSTPIVDAFLQLEGADGSLVEMTPRRFYASLAAIHYLASFTDQYDYRQDEIRQALLHSYQTLSHTEQSLPEQETVEPPEEQGYTPVASQLSRNPSLFEWMRRSALGAVTATYPEDLPQPEGWKFRRWPALGYHHPRETLVEAERETLPLWLRSFQGVGPAQTQPRNESPAISVIVPCYNLGLYLYDALASVLAQTFQDFEVILIDDGSTDEYTRWLVSRLEAPKTRILRQENRGLPATRNLGIRQSRGRYVCCLDADDLLRPGFFATAIPILDSQPDVGLVTGWFELFDERKEVYQPRDFSLAGLLTFSPVMEPALFRKEAWEKVGGYCETFSASGIEDWDLWLSLVEAGYRAHVVPEVLHDYRIRPDAMSVSMYQPETWGRLCRELYDRHRSSYDQHYGKVLENLNIHWAQLKNWSLVLERSEAWWERQSGLWQRTAEESEQEIREQELWIRELEQEAGPADEDQVLLDASDGYGALVEKQKAHIDELEEHLAYLQKEDQSKNDELSGYAKWTQEMQARIDELQAQIEVLGQKTGQLGGELQARDDALQQSTASSQELQARIDDLENARSRLEIQVQSWRGFVLERLWVDGGKGDLLKKLWLDWGKARGYTQNPPGESETDS